jgi:hypothetical protein
MRKRQVALIGAAALLASLALAGCGNGGFATEWRCSSATSCTVTLTSPATNSDPMSWTVTSNDRRVRIVPMSGSIAPGQQVLIHVTPPEGVCPVDLTVQASDVALFGGNSFGSSSRMVTKDAQGVCHTAGAAP